ncbi:MAG: 30S ribosomal protein S15 [Thermoplasmataceae archaeon]|jgi:small subunit ribosomal protein S15|nr:30S ribosomal protein S15 [Candidatus Thermoplasmatota archaeon]
MARMHTRKRGKGKSTRIYSESKPDWVELSSEELEKTVVDLKKGGATMSMIGIKLRDQYGIPGTKSVVGKKIGQILHDNNLSDAVPEDLMNLIKKYKNVSRHIQLNRNDSGNIRGQALLMSKILRLVRYYKRRGSLSKEWNLSRVL